MNETMKEESEEGKTDVDFDPPADNDGERYSPSSVDRNHSPSYGDGKKRSRSRSRSPPRRRSGGPKLQGREARKVFVSNLPWSTTWKGLKDLIKEEIGEECFVTLQEDENGRSKGCGICEFRREEGAEKAIAKMHKRDVKGRKIIVRRETERDRERARQDQIRNLPPEVLGRPDSGAAIAAQLGPELLGRLGIDPNTITNSVFVANLPFKATTSKLKEVFSIAGRVINVDLRTDKEGRSKGYGLVDFETPFEAVQAISMFNGQSLFDRKMEVRMDQQAPGVGPVAPKLPMGLKGIGLPLDPNPLPPPNIGVQAGLSGGLGLLGGDARGAGALGSTGLSGGSGVLAGLGPSGLAALGQLGLTSSAISSLVGLSGGTPLAGGSGVGGAAGSLAGGVSLGSAGSLGSSLSGGLADPAVNRMVAPGVSRMPEGLPPPGADGFDRYGNPMTNIGSRSSSQRGITSQRDCMVAVKNLPYSTTWKTLKDRFNVAGNVQHAEIWLNEDGKSKGTAMVKFSTPEDARRAIALMDGSMLEGRRLVVRMEN